MIPVRPLVGALVALALVAVSGCDSLTSEPFVRRTLNDTFEQSLGGWVADSADFGAPPIELAVERSDELAESGQWSVRLHLANLNDAGKIWIEQPVEFLTPGRTYEVVLAFDFASADFGDVNLWRIIAGASTDDPETAEGLIFQGDTGNGAASDVGFVWMEKSFTFTTQADENGVVWVFAGVWGTSEFTRTYFIDDVEVVLTLQ